MGIGEVVEAPLLDAAEDLVELGVAHEERVVLGLELVLGSGLQEVERDAVGRLDDQERDRRARGSGSPRICDTKSAEALASRAWTIVWLRVTAMSPSVPATPGVRRGEIDSNTIGRVIPTADRAEARRLVEAGSALPSSWYTDPEVFAEEQRRILRRGWHCVTHTGALPAVGDNHLAEIAGVPVVLVRDRAGELRGFVNICRHRAHAVVIEEGNRKHLQCHYHGWSYDLDGSLLRAPRSDEEPGFEVDRPRPAPGAGGRVGADGVGQRRQGRSALRGVDRRAARAHGRAGLRRRLLRGRARPTRGRSAATGRSSRTTRSSATTARPRTRSSARWSTWTRGPRSWPSADAGWIHHRIPFRDGVDLGGMLQPGADGRAYYHYNWIYPATYLQHYGDRFDIGSVTALAPDRIRFTHTTLPARRAPRRRCTPACSV